MPVDIDEFNIWVNKYLNNVTPAQPLASIDIETPTQTQSGFRKKMINGEWVTIPINHPTMPYKKLKLVEPELVCDDDGSEENLDDE